MKAVVRTRLCLANRRFLAIVFSASLSTRIAATCASASAICLRVVVTLSAGAATGFFLLLRWAEADGAAMAMAAMRIRHAVSVMRIRLTTNLTDYYLTSVPVRLQRVLRKKSTSTP